MTVNHYSIKIVTTVKMTIQDKKLFDELREKDLVWTSKEGVSQVDFKMFVDEMQYLIEDIIYNGYDVIQDLVNGILSYYVRTENKSIIMTYEVKPMFNVN